MHFSLFFCHSFCTNRRQQRYPPATETGVQQSLGPDAVARVVVVQRSPLSEKRAPDNGDNTDKRKKKETGTVGELSFCLVGGRHKKPESSNRKRKKRGDGLLAVRATHARNSLADNDRHWRGFARVRNRIGPHATPPSLPWRESHIS
jgi:hypothetical protein